MALRNSNPDAVVVRVPALDVTLSGELVDHVGEGESLDFSILPDTAARLGLEIVNAPTDALADLKRLGYKMPQAGTTPPPATTHAHATANTTPDADAKPSGSPCPVGVGSNVGVWSEESGCMEHGVILEMSPRACVVKLDDTGKVVASVWSEVWATNCGPAGEAKPAPVMRVAIHGRGETVPATIAPHRIAEFGPGAVREPRLCLLLSPAQADTLNITITHAPADAVALLWALGYATRRKSDLLAQNDAIDRATPTPYAGAVEDAMSDITEAADSLGFDIDERGDGGYVRSERLRIARALRRLHADAGALLAHARSVGDHGTVPATINPFRTGANLAHEIGNAIGTAGDEAARMRADISTTEAADLAAKLAGVLAVMADRLDESRVTVAPSGEALHLHGTTNA